LTNGGAYIHARIEAERTTMAAYLLPARAVLFDSDGVLVDSDKSVADAWTRWAQRYQLEPRLVAAMVHGRRASDTVDILIEPAQRQSALAVINAFEIEDARSVVGIPGARDLVASLPADAWAVVTSATAALARARLAAAGIPLPQVLVTADDVKRGKPAPDGYLAAAAALRVPPVESIVVEDTASGVQAGREAGVRLVLGVGERALASDADVVVADLREVTWGDGLVVPRRSVLRASPG
jgi:sugar-phosphatase